jgi:hypothetical protein
MTSVTSEPQFVGDAKVKRQYHVWRKHTRLTWKCVLCGAITGRPNLDDESKVYEPLTNDDRRMCPPAYAIP